MADALDRSFGRRRDPFRWLAAELGSFFAV
jgi:hypothetical protein